MTKNAGGFRADINALRAIAVIAVILYHFKAKLLPGGFAGVDIFFVISGFLMTKIIVERVSTQSFSLLGFYQQRLSRILPALLFLVIVISILCYFLYLPQELRRNSADGLSSLLFYSNVFYYLHAGYFDPTSETNIFLHTWSLSVEWQFYLLYPLLIVLLSRVKIEKFMPLVLGAISIVGALVCFKAGVNHPTASFYFFPTRAWELTAGGLTFFAPTKLSLAGKRALAISGYIGVFISLLLITNSAFWPSSFTLFPIISTMMVLVAGLSDQPAIDWAPVQYVGKISYSLYLWHWPLYVLFIYAGLPFGILTMIILISLTTLCAIFSYHAIEKTKWATSRLVVAWAVAAAVCLGMSTVSVNAFLFEPTAVQLDEYAQNYNSERLKQFSQGKCFISERNSGMSDFKQKECLRLDSRQANYLLIGDSHGADLSQSFTEQLANRNIHLLQATASGCFPLLGTKGVLRCTEIIDFIYYKFIVQHAAQLQGVIISADWYRNQAGLPNTLVKDLNATINYLK